MKTEEYPKPGIFRRIMLGIPPLRHWMFKRDMARQAAETKLSDSANHVMARIIAPNIVKLYNSGTADWGVFESRSYLRTFMTKLIGKKIIPFVDALKIERVRLNNHDDQIIRIIELPTNGEVGQAKYICYVCDTLLHKAGSFLMEHSLNKKFMICIWEEKMHYNYGYVSDKQDFVKKCVSLFSVAETSKSEQ